MRPRKHILLYCDDPDEATLLAYTLEIRLRVSCHLVSDRRAMEYDAALVVRMSEKDDSERMVRQLIRTMNVLLDSRVELDRPSQATLVMVRADRIDVLQQLRMLSLCKRGPRPSLQESAKRTDFYREDATA